MFRNFYYYLNQLWINISRNFLMSTAAISTSFFSQLIFGSLILMIFNINHISNQIWKQVEIRAYIESPEANRENIDALIDQIKKTKPQVTAITKLSPEQAMDSMEKELGMSLWDRDEANPLPWTLIITVQKPDQIRQIVAYLLEMKGKFKFTKDNLRYPEDVVQKINNVSMIIKIGGYILTVLMAGLTLFIIMNTIRLTVIARRSEIRTMQLVGATSWFIRWPFLLEGVIIGLIGSAVSGVLLCIMYYFAYRIFMNLLYFLPHPLGIYEMARILFLMLGLSGLLMGLAGSYISVKRFLEEEL